MLDTELILFLLKTLPYVWFTSGVALTGLLALEVLTVNRKRKEVERLKQTLDNVQAILDIPIKDARLILNDVEGSTRNERCSCNKR